MFRIVSEKRGDAVIGFRVQKQGYCLHKNTEVWRNRGRRMFTVQDAQNLRSWLEHQEQATMLPVVYEEIAMSERPGLGVSWHGGRG